MFGQRPRASEIVHGRRSSRTPPAAPAVSLEDGKPEALTFARRMQSASCSLLLGAGRTGADVQAVTGAVPIHRHVSSSFGPLSGVLEIRLPLRLSLFLLARSCGENGALEGCTCRRLLPLSPLPPLLP
jgi:hypothetical protein